jgi:hypothetical protein
MAEDWTSEYIQLIDDCEKRESRCTEWERKFLSSIRSQLEGSIPLTPKQSETLDNIWERVTSRG